ncbi:glutamine synthetase III [Nitratireductor sp. XY-223]|uniref:glutamine synthetase III n=1 Tax=Nitratireductor sp. XY-223 TaxID=2561926 RepID=UPI00145B2E8A|nr:glutamine synthetase III [Nitratireductor sp. XY-223]
MVITHSTHDAPKQEVALPSALAGINSNVLDDAILKKLVDPDVYYALAQCRATGVPMDRGFADALAKSIREWAQSKGCIGYSHWFSPMRGAIHGEKLETFVGVDFATDRLIVEMSGTQLFQTETDGSSFPNGGLRKTHEAAAYIGWDTGSPPFVYRQTLYIPSTFVSWNGEALDQKTPLLRANMAVNDLGVRLLSLLGDNETREVVCNVGWEQEFFLIDREKYLARPDLLAVGRTLLGAAPLRGQEMDANYFSRLSPRVSRYIAEARDIMWELGISIHCTHNEVAPAQHEISPIFGLANLVADTNVLAMDVLRDLAFDHDFAVLFHEKPFAGINGNGKHNNWSLSTDRGVNLFVPGKTDEDNRRFIAFIAALLRGINRHGDLLRCGVSTAGNDHRLGAQEAPPAIITLNLGERLEAHVNAVADGGCFGGYETDEKEIKVVAPVADIKANLEDRNRTAPFPWCGNRFEFRAVGGNQHIAFPLAMLNAILADSLKHMCDEIDAGKPADLVIRETIKENKGALFSGDGYSEALNAHARQHGLTHLKSSPEAYTALTADKNVELFGDLGIFNRHELTARQAVLQEAYASELYVEARALLRILRTLIIPVAIVDADVECASGFQSRLFDEKRKLVEQLLSETGKLDELLGAFPNDDPGQSAWYAHHELRPCMQSARIVADMLETLVDGRSWPLPGYSEILHHHQ